MARLAELRELTRHRVLGFLRQPEALFWVFVFPLVLAAVLGFAFQGRGLEPSRIAVLEGTTGELVERLDAAEHVRLERFADLEAAQRALSVAKVDAFVADALADPPVVRLDPQREEAELARLRIAAAHAGLGADSVRVDPVTERGARYVDFLFPGLLGMNLMGTGIWAIGFAVAELRQRKVLKRLLVTPMRRSSFLASFLLARLVFLVLEVLALTLVGVYGLGVPFRAGVLSFGVICLFAAVSMSGLGLLAAARVKTIEGASGMMNLVMMPMWLGSGVFFSYERFPAAVQPVLELLPLSAINDALRASMLEGVSLVGVLPQLAILAVWTVGSFALALRLFRWV